MLKRLLLILALVLIPLTASAETYVDPETHVKFNIPEGWRLFTADEKAKSNLSSESIPLTPIGEARNTRAILVHIMRYNNQDFLSTDSASTLQPYVKGMVNMLRKEGNDVLDADLFPSRIGYGVVILYTRTDKMVLQYRINSPNFTITAAYVLPEGLEKNEYQKMFDTAFPLFNSIQIP